MFKISPKVDQNYIVFVLESSSGVGRGQGAPASGGTLGGVEIDLI